MAPAPTGRDCSCIVGQKQVPLLRNSVWLAIGFDRLVENL